MLLAVAGNGSSRSWGFRAAPALVVASAFLLAACSSDDPNAGSGASSSVATGSASSAAASGSGGAAATSTGASTVGTGGATAGGGAGSSAASSGSAGTAGGSGGATGTGGNGGAGGVTSDPSVDSGAPGDGAPDAASSDGGVRDASGPFALTSTAFREGETVPLMYKCSMVPPAGQNISPPLAWTPGPAATKSYAMTLLHNAADMSIHWVLWDIPASMTSLAENIEQVATPATPAGAKQVRPNLDGSTWYGYQGPCPQAVGARQSYLYAVYALDVDTLPGVTPQSTSAQAMSAIRAHMLARATLSGTQIRQ